MNVENEIDYSDGIKNYIEKEINILKNINISSIHSIMRLIIETYNNEGTIYTCGNGGSASTASHMQNDFNKGISEFVDKKFRFYCLNDNVATMLAIANDISYDEIFRFQIRNKITANDLIIGISGSGNSQNIINAITYAKEQGAKTIGVVGYDGGKLSQIADEVFHVPINNMQIVEDVHLILNHAMMRVIMEEWNLKCH